ARSLPIRISPDPTLILGARSLSRARADPGSDPCPALSRAGGLPSGARACDDLPVTTTTTEQERLPLRRPTRGRWLGGVAMGLALHLGVPVGAVRLGLVGLGALGGIGAVLYVWLWVTVPVGDPFRAAEESRPPAER